MTDAIDLTTEQRKTLNDLLRRFLPGVAVWAYGSRVKWTAHPNSDLDLVAFTVPEQRAQVADLKDALAESNLSFPVDLHVWDEEPERFREIIRKDYVVVQEAKEPDGKRGLAGKRLLVTAQEFCASVRDGTHDSPKPVEHGRSLVTSRHITGGRLDLGNAYLISQEDFDATNKRSKVDRWDVLISMIGTVGEPCLVRDDPDFAIKNIGLFKSKGEVEGMWLYYYLRTADAQQLIHEQARGTTQQYIPLGVLREFPIPVPGDPEEMCAVVHILGTLDDKIELNRQMNETLEAMARALFKSWFVDFDPVRAKAEGRDTGLPKHLADLFPDSFEDSELGEIPRGWKLRAIEELAERVAMGPFGSSIKVSTFVPDGIPVISGQHLRGTLLDDSEFNFVAKEHAEQLKRSNVQRGDVIFTHAGSIGQVAYVPETSRYERYVISQRQFYMRCNQEKMSPLFITAYFKTQEGQHRLLANTSSTGVPSISQPVSYLRQLKIVVPLNDLLSIFDSAARSIYRAVAHNKDQSRTLENLRDTLLPKLISGEFRVKDAERFVKVAT